MNGIFVKPSMTAGMRYEILVVWDGRTGNYSVMEEHADQFTVGQLVDWARGEFFKAIQ